MSKVKFYGYIDDIGEVNFNVVFTEENKCDELYAGVIPVDTIPEEDRRYLIKGNYFTWIVEHTGTNYFEFNEELWTEEEIDKAKMERDRVKDNKGDK